MLNLILGLFGYKAIKTDKVELVQRLLNYSFEDIGWEYKYLTNSEKDIIKNNLNLNSIKNL